MSTKLEDMTINEFLIAVCDIYKDPHFKPRKLKTAPNDTILLEPNNENDEEYGGYE